jgi:hypothetical protein
MPRAGCRHHCPCLLAHYVLLTLLASSRGILLRWRVARRAPY